MYTQAIVALLCVIVGKVILDTTYKGSHGKLFEHVVLLIGSVLSLISLYFIAN